MTIDALATLVNPTSCLPRLKAEPDAAHVHSALLHLSRLYSPQSLSKDERNILVASDAEYAASSYQDALDSAKVDGSEIRYAMDWLTRLIASGLYWIDEARDHISADDLLDLAGRILGGTASLEEAGAISREFRFPLKDPILFSEEAATLIPSALASQPIEIVLRDDPLPPSDAQSEANTQSSTGSSQDAAAAVGVQTWGASIVVSDVLVRYPALFHRGLASQSHLSDRRLRIAELGAGTGLLGMVAARMLQQTNGAADVVLTDYHQQVLKNLEHNVGQNFGSAVQQIEPPGKVSVSVEHLDWLEMHHEILQGVVDNDRPKFDLLLLADVIYAPEHALWIRSSIEALLRKPINDQDEALSPRAHIIMAVRGTGKFEGLFQTVEDAFKPRVQASALPSLSDSCTDTPMDTMPGTPALAPEFATAMNSKATAQHSHELHIRMSAFSLQQPRASMERSELTILKRRKLDKRASVGRDDEQEYLWFEIGWSPCISTCNT